MNPVLKFLFPAKQYSTSTTWLLMAARIIFGTLLMSHGIAKWVNFESMASGFPDPLGVGSHLSLTLAIFGEVFCSAAFIAGALYRLAMLPMIFTMGMAVFVIHGSDPFAVKELAVTYLAIFILMYIAGPGKFSVDRLIACRLWKTGEKPAH